MRREVSLAFAAALALGAVAWAGAAAAGNLSDPAALNAQAPAVYKAKFDTSKGPFVIEVNRDWAPRGADRFYNLVKNGFFDNARFFRVIEGFMVQFGINGDPAIAGVWRDADIKDDPVKQSNKRGTITFATAGPNTRTTQVFINFADNAPLDGQGFSPFGKVVSGMEVVDSLYGGYGEGAPNGNGPDQGRVQQQGNAYLEKNFPKLDFIKTATIAE
jgi:peptidyl-prolyl cis-trans isomerase A (cyclophilin A)